MNMFFLIFCYNFKYIHATSTGTTPFCDRAFQNFQLLQEIHCSNGFYRFNKYSFDGCGNLEKVIITSTTIDTKICDYCFNNCPKLTYFQYCRNDIFVHTNDKENLLFGGAKLAGLTIIVPAVFARSTFSGQDYINNGTTVEYNDVRYKFESNGVIIEAIRENNQITYEEIVNSSKNTLCDCTPDFSIIRFIGNIALVLNRRV